jgi:hypothetical protein
MVRLFLSNTQQIDCLNSEVTCHRIYSVRARGLKKLVRIDPLCVNLCLSLVPDRSKIDPNLLMVRF